MRYFGLVADTCDDPTSLVIANDIVLYFLAAATPDCMHAH